MATFIDVTQNILSQNTICFETRLINVEQINVPLENSQFGILDFKAVTSHNVLDILEFLFIIDCSGSMSDKCADGRTKMQHITHTLKNMIIFFKEHPNIKLFVTIYAFDTEIYNIVERTPISKDNILEILAKIDQILPRGSTNIEFALENSSKEINKIKNLYPTHKINHIFMTDGEATSGSNDITILQSYIVSDVTNIFIGFGIEHDSTLLNGISSVGNSSYYFIDKLESAGLVYGEILHSIVYKILTEPEITIKNGLIYDYKTNTWVENLKIGDIISEANKIFNIASNNIHDCAVEIKGNHGTDLTIIFPSIHIESADLTRHVYRQRTLQLLFEVSDFLKKYRPIRKNSPDIFGIFGLQNSYNNSELYDEKIRVKHKLSEFIIEMKNYMEDNKLENDKILKNLCDDIYVCYRSFDTKYGSMFCTSRHTSQGTQRIYTASNTEYLDENDLRNNSVFRFRGRRLTRHTNHFPQNFHNTTNVSILDHELSSFDDTPYLTPQATNVMRAISSQTTDDNLNLNLNLGSNYDDKSQDTFKT